MTMLTPDEALYALLCKYLLKEADSNEQQWVNTWLQASPEHPVLLASLDRLLRTAPEQAVPGAMDTEMAWRLLSSRIVERDATFNGPAGASLKSYTRWLAAASILLLLGIGTWYLTHQNERQINYSGAQLVKLDDGTSIQLDTAATLQVLPGFGQKNRKVILTGKAEFDVTTNAAHPFIIDLGGQAITVLGTRFSVDNRQQLLVFIHSGKIKLSRQHDSVILSAGMLLEEDTSRQHYQVGAHITDAATHAVVFKDTPLREVLQTIHVLYHVNVTADAALLELPVTATYTGEPLERVLEAIAYLSNANVINKGADYELRKQE